MEVYLIIAAVLVVMLSLIFLGGGTSHDKDEIEKGLYDAEKLISGDVPRMKEGLIKFDNLLNKALQMKGFRGQTVADRLKSSRGFFEWGVYSGLWDAHKLRNKIVHEDYTPSSTELRKSVKYFKSGIKKLMK